MKNMPNRTPKLIFFRHAKAIQIVVIYFVVVTVIIISSLFTRFPLTFPLETMVNPTTQALSFRL
jgi:hypothetical protein